MNRRGFLASIPFLPSAVKAVVTMPADQVVVPKRDPEIDAIMDRLYQMRNDRVGAEHFDMIVDQNTAKAIQKAYARYYRKKYGVAA